MRIRNDYPVIIAYLFVLLVSIVHAVRNYKLESQVGSTIILPSCLPTSPSLKEEMTTILFKSDSGELLIMNGRLISENPRFFLKNNYSSELIIRSVQSLDQGQYECRTDQMINSIVHLNIVRISTIHLTIPENSNLTLQCMENGLWTIEESHRGGPVRTQYSTEFIIYNIQRDDPRFRTIICSNLNGNEKREYILDITYKPTVKLILSTRRRLLCIVCAHPLPHRIQWWWNTRKEHDDNIHQKSINQSCIAQQITLDLENQELTSDEQMITCEAENSNGIDRDSLLFKTSSIINQNTLISKSAFEIANNHWTTVDTAKNQVSSHGQISTFTFIVISVLPWSLNELIPG